MVVVARVRVASVVWVEISKLYHLANRSFVSATDLFTLSKTDGGRTAVLRSHTVPALDHVDTVFWSDCRLALRNARGAAGSKQMRCALSRPRTRHDFAMIRRLLPRRLSSVPDRFP